MRLFTEEQIRASKAMPRKRHPLHSVDNSPEGEKYRRRNARDRKAIARFYSWLRNHPEDGDARLCHRLRVVTTGTEARTRLKNLTAVASSNAPRWN